MVFHFFSFLEEGGRKYHDVLEEMLGCVMRSVVKHVKLLAYAIAPSGSAHDVEAVVHLLLLSCQAYTTCIIVNKMIYIKR